MENILVVGVNTRPIACSLKNMGYNVYSVDYFGCQDLKRCVTDYQSLLSQKPFHSCGFFSQTFNSELLFEMAQEFVELADHIICSSGASPQQFPKDKLIGNKDVNSIENKYKLYKKLQRSFEGVFKLPETYLVSDVQEAYETADSSEAENFLLKPIQGSGGIGIHKLDSIDPSVEIHEAILQEIVRGSDVSASVLSSGDEATTILTSQQLIGSKWLGQMETYGYSGNIAPYRETTNTTKNSNINFKEVAEEVVRELKLIGSNGVDMIVKDDDVYVIEVNPRFQGTFEVAEASLGINMAEAHIMACGGDIMEVPRPKKFAVKMIVFSKDRCSVGNLDFNGINDIPVPKVIIEKGEPVATVLTSGKVLENTVYMAEGLVKSVYQYLKPITY